MSYERSPRVVDLDDGGDEGHLRVLRVGWDEADAAACRLRLVHRKEGAELRDGAQRRRVEPRGDGAELASRVDRPGGLGLRPRAETAAEIGVHGGDGDGQRIGDRDQQVAGDVLAAALDLGQVGGRAPGLSGDLAEASTLRLAVAAKDGAQLLTDLFRALRSEQNSQRSEHITVPIRVRRAAGRGRPVRRYRSPCHGNSCCRSTSVTEPRRITTTAGSPASTSAPRPSLS